MRSLVYCTFLVLVSLALSCWLVSCCNCPVNLKPKPSTTQSQSKH